MQYNDIECDIYKFMRFFAVYIRFVLFSVNTWPVFIRKKDKETDTYNTFAVQITYGWYRLGETHARKLETGTPIS